MVASPHPMIRIYNSQTLHITTYNSLAMSLNVKGTLACQSRPTESWREERRGKDGSDNTRCLMSGCDLLIQTVHTSTQCSRTIIDRDKSRLWRPVVRKLYIRGGKTKYNMLHHHIRLDISATFICTPNNYALRGIHKLHLQKWKKMPSEVFSPAAKGCTSSTNSPYVTAGYALSKNHLEKA